MKKTLFSAVVALCALGAIATADAKPKPKEAPPADKPHAYDIGPVWDIAYVETKSPQAFEDYMHFLAGPRAALDAEYKKLGDILYTKVLTVQDARDGEPDIILITVYKNMAVFDRSIADNDAIAAKVFGSVSQSDAAAGARADIRKLRGDILAREMILKSPPQ